jgi:hypothetical protein
MRMIQVRGVRCSERILLLQCLHKNRTKLRANLSEILENGNKKAEKKKEKKETCFTMYTRLFIIQVTYNTINYLVFMAR